MDITELMSFIGNVGIPGVVCFVMLYMFYKVLDRLVPTVSDKEEEEIDK